MDVQDGLGGGGEQGMWEPDGAGSGSGSTDPSGYDGAYDDGGTDGSGGYDDGTEDGGTDDDGTDDGSGTGSSGGEGGDGGTRPAGGTLTVEVEGQTRELPAERDYTGDGRPDAAAETSDGKVIIFADTENNETGAVGPDGKADEAYVVDKETGRVVGAAHIDPASGEWVEGTDTDGPSATQPAGSGGDPGTTRDGGSGETPVVMVEVGGQEIGVPLTVDTDGDGQADSGVIYQDGKAIVLTSTDADPAAEQATVVDPATGQVVQVSHVDPETGEWEDGPAPSPGGEPGSGGPGTGGEPGAGSDTMVVDLGGQSRELPAERDYTGDGRPDAAAETKDGKVIVFADTENNETGAAGPDGKADEAYVVDKETGRVVGAAHVDPRTGEWVEGVDTDGSPAVPAASGGGSGVDS